MSGDESKKIVEAEEFRLVDKEGRLRARIFLDEGEPKVALFAGDGKKRAAMGLLSTGEASIALYDNNGKYHFLVNVSADGTPDLSIKDRDGREVFPYEQEPERRSDLSSEILPHVKNKGLKWLLKK
jgi:hypothetical protein